MRNKYLSIEVEGYRIDWWESCKLESNMLQPSDTFSMSLGLSSGSVQQRTNLRNFLQQGFAIDVYVFPDPANPETRIKQHTGVIDSFTFDASGNGTKLDVSCRDLAAHLVDSSSNLYAARRVASRRAVPSTSRRNRSRPLTEEQAQAELAAEVARNEAADRAAAAGETVAQTTNLRRRQSINFIDIVTELVAPWDIPVTVDAWASRDIATGRNITTRRDAQLRRQARAAGISRRDFSRQQRELAAAGRAPAQSIAGTSQRSRDQHANGMVGADIRRIRVGEAKPQAGETVWEFIDRTARRLGLLAWMSPNGELVIGSPDYGQDPTFSLTRRVRNDPSTPNNIITGTDRRSIGERFSEVTVYGRGGSRDATRARIKHTERNEHWTLPYPRPRVIHDQSIRSVDEAERRAKREISRFERKARAYEYTVGGFGDGVNVYAVDTVIEVHDEYLAVDDLLYVTARTFSLDPDSGPTTALTLVPLGTILV